MPAWGSQLFENDATQSAIHDLLESPNATEVIRESLTLAQNEPGELDDSEVAALLAAAAAVDYVVYGTPYGSHDEGLERLNERFGAEAAARFEEPLSDALAEVLKDHTLADFFADPETTGDFAAFRKTVEQLQERLSPDHHGDQDAQGTDD